MPKLRTLQLDYARTMPLDAQIPLRPGLHFAVLEEFGLEQGELDSYTLLFESLSGEHGIKRLDVGFEGCTTGCSVARFIRAVSNTVSRDTLSHFQLYTEDRCEQSAQPSHAIDNHMLFPLLEFRKMDYFLLMCCGHAWDNRILEDMARAWPRLDTLGLQPHSGEAQDTQLTLGGLYPLAKHCPRLNYIDVAVAPFDGIADRLPKRDWEPVDLRRAEPMTVNIFSRKVDRAAIAYLQDMFPRLLVNHISVNDVAVLQYMDEDQD
ncbi:hypothetical protein EWM64_g8346 [Hericium alpestre]|uniref:Uncharacterized protein n=1 Tax=Hericium alpestre TaxID=135208 RepID=A0A4Y9ZLD7_9AGAM|nr:hypothetical protein EWM64_g8346 [Hericium alpestre]